MLLINNNEEKEKKRKLKIKKGIRKKESSAIIN